MKLLKKIEELRLRLVEKINELNGELMCYRMELEPSPMRVEIYSKDGGRRVCDADEIYSSGEYKKADQFEKAELKRIANVLDVRRSYAKRRKAETASQQ